MTAALGENEVVAIYDGANRLGEATVGDDGRSWTYDFSTPVSFGSNINLAFDGNSVSKRYQGPSSGQVAEQKLAGDGKVSTTVDETTTTRTFGLNKSDDSQNAADLDYAIQLNSDGTAAVYENGVLRTESSVDYAEGDVFSVQRIGTQITYLKNGEVFYTSTVPAPSTDLLVDTAFESQFGTLKILSLKNQVWRWVIISLPLGLKTPRPRRQVRLVLPLT